MSDNTNTFIPEIWTFLDVETPNKTNDKICSIGIIQTDPQGSLLDKKYFLIDPEARFDEINMRIHGIAPFDVKGKITFPELWSNYLSKAIIDNGTVAHNASFDLNVICKTLANYNIPIPSILYADTMAMARSALSSLTSCKLPDVCAALDITLTNHHKADSDAEACKDVFWSIVKRTKRYPSLDEYQFMVQQKAQTNQRRTFNETTTRMQILKSMIEDFVSDSNIDIDEAISVLNYISSNEELYKDPAVSSLADLLQRCVVDGYISDKESVELSKAFSYAVNPVSELSTILEFKDKNFVLTGEFEHGAKSSVEAIIKDKGGLILKSVTKKCNYVVVGGQGSESYAMGNYGTKVKKALDWQAKGVPIKIISENQLFESLT